MFSLPLKDSRVKNIVLYFLVLLIAVGIKIHYSRADGADLKWMLSPTAHTVGVLSGISFEPAGNAGYINRAKAVVIAPACAGVNFFIIIFCMSAFIGIYRLSGPAKRTAWIFFALLAGYGVTILINAMRIIVSIRLYGADIYGSFLTPARMHEATGILIYLSMLYLCYFFIDAALSERPAPGKSAGASPVPGFITTGLMPVLAYLCLTIAVPLLNNSFARGKARFLEHTALVMAGCILVYGSTLLIRLSYFKFRRKIEHRRSGLFLKPIKSCKGAHENPNSYC